LAESRAQLRTNTHEGTERRPSDALNC
jgi:hypothetical protein